ncbi:MAG TPA: NAD(P)H-dependent glycerol-3-phosphate dehydrogenase [Candidatus Binataceae bacterium]|nr:NAD(P)H-dependent glycerol-3-phosphate dehydrogenase [Candidatus Binataceae bacterium]
MAEPAVAVIGAGAWGTALASILAHAGHRTTLCVRRAAQLAAISEARENSVYLPGVKLPVSLGFTEQWESTVASADYVLMVTPSRFARDAASRVASSLRPGVTIVSATKGIEEDSLKTMTAMMAEFAPPSAGLAVLSGPGFAAEIVTGKPAALVVASREDAVTHRVQHLLSGRFLRLYRSSDVIGVELGGAIKNVIGIAAGVGDGLALGSSARAALITRGVAEMTRLAMALGAQRQTMAGLAGLGDLVLTCTGEISRNHALGLRLASGRFDILSESGEGKPVAEGVANARSIKRLAERESVDMPIVSAVYRCLYEGGSPRAMVEELLSRELKAEF